MKKSELKTGMVVETKTGIRYQVMLNTPHGDILQGDGGYNNLEWYSEDLEIPSFPDCFDAVAVYSTKHDERGYRKPLRDFSNCLWRREEVSEISMEAALTMLEKYIGFKVKISK